MGDVLGGLMAQLEELKRYKQRYGPLPDSDPRVEELE
jgi:hypothetical protein